jgi:predicted  nucleic acid-binding Zn-ribbon protein
MAAANDNQGLKIAVAALVMLVFILGVTNYFAFSSSSREFAHAEQESKKAADSDSKARAALEQANYYRTLIGYPNIDAADPEAVKAAIKKDNDRISADIQGIGAEFIKAVSEVQQAGEADPKLEELKGIGQGIVASIASEPNENKVYVKSLDRMKAVLENQSRLMRELALDYRKLRADLTSANSINNVEVAKTGAARDQAAKEKQDEIGRIKTEVQSLHDQITALQNSEKDKTNQITDLTNQKNDVNTQFANYRRDSEKAIVQFRDKLSLKETELGKAIGRVTYVDYNRQEVRVSVNKSMGAKPMMTFTVFDRDARGIPTDKPKGVVELVSVGDPATGQPDSLGKIVETRAATNPIRYNDQIYSPAFLPDYPQRFALMGKIDVNRDGKDDRLDLIRLIEQSGGMIEYDLPPPGVDRTPGRLAVERAYAKIGEPVPAPTGRASGHISPLCRAYILDQRGPLNAAPVKDSLTPEWEAFSKEVAEATKDARANGVPPMPIERLLTQLGYTPPVGGFTPGTVEMRNRPEIKKLIKPRSAPAGATPPAQPPAGGNAPASGAPAGAMPDASALPKEDPNAPK